uniref:E2F/DP family winged-helix DNA-binding domain-containing protein n=1 Tax=Aegilops tauschii subsp. strangulata TaxID=200361 RepID=A0A453PLF7_AEGTS
MLRILVATFSDHRKEKSLGLLTQNFVKLFLTMEQVSTISLDEAAKFLLGEGHEESNMRTKVRRLYDIANVLSSLKLIEKTQVDTRKPAFRWLGMAGKPKAENGVTVVASPARKTLSNKRVFGTELTNIGINRSQLEPTIQKKAKLAQGGADILKSYNVAAQKQPGQVNKSGFVYGPFHPSCARKQEPDDCNNWESLADSFRPQYQNPALGDLFAHYVDAWKSWYSEFSQGSGIMQQHLGSSVNNKRFL